MITVGIIEKSTNAVVYTFPAKYVKQHPDYDVLDFKSFQYDPSKYKAGYYYVPETDSVLYDEDYTPPAIDPQIIVSEVVRNSTVFGQKLMEDFATENVLMGITQLGLTAEVLSIMEEKVEIDPVNKPGVRISVMGAVQSTALYEAITVLEVHKSRSQAGDYDALAPFLTVERLSAFQQKIVDFLS